MRKVLFKRWIPSEFITTSTNPPQRQKVEGTGGFEPEFINEGVFHQWASSYEEFEQGAGNFTVALVELQNGTIEEVLPKNIKFI